MKNKDDLFSSIQCALLHNMDVCSQCMKCEGNSAVEIRINMADKLAEYLRKEREKNESN